MKKIHLFTFLMLTSGLFILQACKKSETPEKEEEPKKEWLVDKVSIRQVVEGEPAPRWTHVLTMAYDDQFRVVRISQSYPDIPAGGSTPADGIYDTYEYDATGKLTKHNLYRRRNSSMNNPIEHTEYYAYEYDAQGLPSKITRYMLLQLPPTGALGFSINSYSTYTHNAQKQLTEVKYYWKSYDDFAGNVEYLYQSRYTYSYGNNGNLISTIHYDTYTGTPGDKLSETRYNSYDGKANPFFSAAAYSASPIPFQLLAELPLDISIIGNGELVGLSNASSTRKFTVKRNEHDFPTTIEEIFDYKNIVNGSSGWMIQQGQKGTIEYTITFTEKK